LLLAIVVLDVRFEDFTKKCVEFLPDARSYGLQVRGCDYLQSDGYALRGITAFASTHRIVPPHGLCGTA
jgi:hypothetical protein